MVIKRIISSERHEWIVVSSDREIANHAWSIDTIPIPSETFLTHIEGAGYKEGFDTEENNEYPGSQKKGNPNKLSKKEKAIIRALSKL